MSDLIVAVQTVAGEARADSRELDPYFFLAEAVRYTLNQRLDLAAAALRHAQAVATPEQEANVHLLTVAVASEMALMVRGQRAGKKEHPHNEFGAVQFWFKKHFRDLLPGAELVRFERLNGRNPDFMLRIDGALVPVECKLNFNARALNQLTSYMDAYGAQRGVAVALRLTCSLPENVQFFTCPEESRHV